LKAESSIPFFTDNDVEDEVGDFLIHAGHAVIRLRDVMLGNSPDPIVDANCRQNGLVLITHNYKHFRKIALDLESGGRGAKRLSRIDMEIHQSDGPRRVGEVLHLIECEWQAHQSIQMSICKEVVRVRR
jgi:hypothetical protein